MHLRTNLGLALAILPACGSTVTLLNDDAHSGAGGAPIAAAATVGAGGASQCLPDWSPCGGNKLPCCGPVSICSQGVCQPWISPPADGTCHPGDPAVALASGQPSPGALAIDADYVYFTTVSDVDDQCAPNGIVKRVPKKGGPVEAVAVAKHALFALAADSQRLFWSDDPVPPCTKPVDYGYEIVAATKDGANEALLGPSQQFAPASDIALDGAFAYWVSSDTGGSLRRVAKNGGKAETLFASNTKPAAPATFALALSAADVFWNRPPGVARVPKTGGTPIQLTTAPVLGSVAGMVVDGTDLYFGAYADCQGADCALMGSILRVDTHGGAPQVAAASADWRPVRLAIDADSVYWTEQYAGSLAVVSGRVMRLARNGGSVATLAKGQMPIGIAIDASCVYFADALSGTIVRAPKSS